MKQDVVLPGAVTQAALKPDRFLTADLLSGLIAGLAALVSAAGIFTNLYRDAEAIRVVWRANDLVTLAVGVPLLLGSRALCRRADRAAAGIPRARIVWLGAVGYMLYNYVFYLFGAQFNAAFLGYVALAALSIYALVFSLPRLDVQGAVRQFSPRLPARGIAAFLLAFSLSLGAAEVAQVLQALASGTTPLSLVFAVDLTLLMPLAGLCGIWLWQRRPWGFVLSAALMIKDSTYPLALILMAAAQARVTGVWDPFTPYYAVMGAGCMICAGLLLGSMKPPSILSAEEDRPPVAPLQA